LLVDGKVQKLDLSELLVLNPDFEFRGCVAYALLFQKTIKAAYSSLCQTLWSDTEEVGQAAS
jgi:hypothetical protein